MAKKEIPQGAVFAIIAVLVIGVAIVGFIMYKGSNPVQVKPETLTPQRLEDPDMRGKS